jgi:ABC-2 type transport system permease protein
MSAEDSSIKTGMASDAHKSGSGRKPFLIIARFEWRILKRDRTALWIAGLLGLIATLSALNNFFAVRRQYQAVSEAVGEQAAQYEKTRMEIERAERKRVEQGLSPTALRSGLPAPEAVRTNISNFRAALPPSSYAVLGMRQDDLYPANYTYRLGERFSPYQPTVGTRSLAGLFPERSTENPLALWLGQFDLPFVMIYLYPLAILALSFNMIAAEREAGALALVLSQPIRFRALILGKLGVRALLILICGVLVPAFAALGAELRLPARGTVLSLLLWMLAAAGYGAFWFGLAVCVNAFCGSAAGNALWLAGCWIMFVALIPPLVNLTAQTLRPLQASISYADVERAANLKFNAEADQVGFEIRDAVNSAHQVISGDPAGQARRDQAYYEVVAQIPEGAELLAEYFKRHPEWPQPATPGQLNYAVEEARLEAIERRLADVIERMNAERERRQSLIDGLAFFSPAILFQNAVDEITGASQARHQRFLAQLDDYVRARDALFTSKIIRRENVRAVDIDQISRFEYREESFLQVVKRAAINLIGLFLPTSLIVWFVNRAMRRFSAVMQ